MSKKITYRSLSLLMAFLVFTSSISFAIDIHYCGGHVKSINFFGEAETCHKIEQESTSSTSHECCKKKNDERSHCEMENDKNCCHNEQIVFEQDNDLKLSDNSTVNLEEISPVLVYLFVSQHLFDFKTKPTFYSYYDPPLLSQNKLVQQQVFRI
ncbi:MAG: hypothetical protein WED10_10500 [Brumimicrobium sp.]